MADTPLQTLFEREEWGEGLPPGELDPPGPGRAAPAAGDTVRFTVEGTVDNIDEQEGVAYVKPEKANGKPIPQENENSDNGTTEDDLQQKAQQAYQQS